MEIVKYIFFNFLTVQAFNENRQFSFLGKRIQLMQTDFLYQVLICAPLFLIAILAKYILREYRDVFMHIPNLAFIVLVIIINKDFFHGQSIIKRLKGYQIVDIKSNLPANPIQCAIRNCTIVIWPIEVVIALFNPTRRLGDYIARTKLIEDKKSNPELILNDMQKLKFDSTFLITLFVSASIMAIFGVIVRYI